MARSTPSQSTRANPERFQSAVDGVNASVERLAAERRDVRADARLHFGLGVAVFVISAILLGYFHVFAKVDSGLAARTEELSSVRRQAFQANGQYVACSTNTTAIMREIDPSRDYQPYCRHWLQVAADWERKEKELLDAPNAGEFFSSDLSDLFRAITQLLFVVLLNIAGFAFFRAYWNKNRYDAFLSNEITNLELKNISFNLLAKRGADAALERSIISTLMTAERNFIAGRG